MRERKKILYVITKSVWGGAQRYVFDLATNLPKDRFDVAVIAGGLGPLVEKLNQAGIRTLILPVLQENGALFRMLFSLINFRSLLQLIRIFQQERPDIVHLNSSKIGGLGAIASFVWRILYPLPSTLYPRIIFTVHGWGFKEDRPFFSRAIIFFLSWLSSLFQDKIILINTADLRTAQKFIPSRKLALIFNGIGPTSSAEGDFVGRRPVDFLPRAEARAFFSKKIGQELTQDIILIGTIAELTKNKGLLYLIAALSRLNLDNIIGVVIGDGEDREKLQNQIGKLKLQDTVHLVNFLPDASRYLKGLDIFILPSLKEGLPYTIMEALTAGLPVLATKVGGIPDLIEDGRDGILVAPKNSQELARAIVDLMENKDARIGLGENARVKFKTKFLLDVMLKETVRLYY